MLLIRVTLPPLDKYKCFQPANLLSIFSRIGFHIVLSLNLAPKGRPRYFIGREPSLQPRTTSKRSILWTTPTGINSNLPRFIFRPDTASNQMSADISQGALEGNMVSFVRYPNIKDANLNMHILQTAGIEEIVSPLMVIKPNSIWLVIERIDCTLHDYMKQLPRKWCYGKLDDTTKILFRYVMS